MAAAIQNTKIDVAKKKKGYNTFVLVKFHYKATKACVCVCTSVCRRTRSVPHTSRFYGYYYILRKKTHDGKYKKSDGCNNTRILTTLFTHGAFYYLQNTGGGGRTLSLPRY